MAIDGQVCFHRQPFAIPVRPPRCTIGSWGPVNGINKDVSGTRLLPTTVLTYPVLYNCNIIITITLCYCMLLYYVFASCLLVISSTIDLEITLCRWQKSLFGTFQESCNHFVGFYNSS